MSVPAERRHKKRYEIRLLAQIGPVDGPRGSCLVRDYCSGGMLVQLTQPAAMRGPVALRSGQPAQLKTELLTAKGARPVRIRATVAWVKDDYLGLSFPKASESVVEALRRHDQLARVRIEAEPRPGAAQTATETRSLARLRHVAQGDLPGLLRLLLVTAGQELLEKASAVSSNAEQQQVFEDVNALEALRQNDRLPRAVMELAFGGQTGIEPESEPADGQLTLIEPEEFERWLEASRVATALHQKFSTQLSELSARLGTLHEGELQASLSVPFEPEHFAGALKDIAKELDLGATSRSVLFDCAARVLKENLGDFYSRLDAALDASGAPPAETGHKIKTLSGSKSGQAGGADATGPSPSGAGSRPGVEGDAGIPRVAVDQELLAALLAREAEQREQQANELMSFVADTPNMSDSLAAWLQQLGGPLAREAAADRTFFQNRQHPLREIVDRLGHLQLFRPTPDRDPESDPVLQRISELLKPIGSGKVDAATQRSIAAAIGELTSEQSRLYQRNVERVAEASEGRDRVRRARTAIADEINRRYGGRQVPAVVPELLDVGWRAVLELGYLNSIDGDDRYAGHLDALDGVIARLGGDAYAADSDEIDAGQLFESIEAELNVAAFDPFRRNAVETRLREELFNPAQAMLVEMPLLQDASGVMASGESPKGVDPDTWRSLLERCMQVAVGDGVRLLDAAEGAQELRVAWIRNDHELFVLVDHRGLRVRDISLVQLALGLHRHRIELHRSDGRPLSDRAVDSILQRMEGSVSGHAAKDSLTGLINRQQFHAALEKALAMPGHSQGAGVLMWIDVDQFRLVNDIHDYNTGDRLLEKLARLLEQVKGAKVLGHMGGDRFAALLPDIDIADGERRAARVCKAVREMPFEWQGQGLGLSVSIGVVAMTVGRGGLSSLLQAAEHALTAAKFAGGNRAYVYREDDPNITRRKESVQWVAQVDDALSHGQLRLRCQPIVPVRTDQGLVPHYEILLGVNNAAAQSLPIAEFIDAAERYKRMRAVDRWVTRTAMEWIAANRNLMPRLHGFAVNLSGQTASDPTFIEFVREQFRHTGIEPSWLSFEVTETAAVSDLSSSAGIIRDLKGLGCKVALDDFGSGLASYSYLKELPVDWLKIDGAFVRKIAADRDDFAVVRSINEIGHFLGKMTIAEYVTDDAVLQRVREIGVDYAQGFGISPPILLDDLLESVEDGPAIAVPAQGR